MDRRTVLYAAAALAVLALALLSVAFPALGDPVAQGDPTEQQQTIDAIVAGYFTQTAQAQAAQTLQAQVDAALTATAAIQTTAEAQFRAAQTATARPALLALDVSAWTLAGVEDTLTTIGDVGFFAGAALAPDGSAIAWPTGNQGLCLYPFAQEETTCYPWPEDCDSTGTNLTWSADSRTLAFTSNFFRFYNEPDIHTFDVAAGAFTNRTPDDVLRFTPGEDSGALLDYLPTWNPSSGDLYFFRSEVIAEGYTLVLYRLPAAGGAPEQVRDLTDDLPPAFPIFQPAAISPDGARMAVVVLSRDLEEPRNGIWVLHLESGEIEQVAVLGDLQAGLPAWQEAEAIWPRALAWAGYSGIVVASLDSQFQAAIAYSFYFVDLTTGEVTPLIDYSDITELADLYWTDDDGLSPLHFIAREAAISPDGGAFLYTHFDPRLNRAGIAALPLPPDGREPIPLGEMDFAPYRGEPKLLHTLSADGRALFLYHDLLTFTAQP